MLYVCAAVPLFTSILTSFKLGESDDLIVVVNGDVFIPHKQSPEHRTLDKFSSEFLTIN